MPSRRTSTVTRPAPSVLHAAGDCVPGDRAGRIMALRRRCWAAGFGCAATRRADAARARGCCGTSASWARARPGPAAPSRALRSRRSNRRAVANEEGCFHVGGSSRGWREIIPRDAGRRRIKIARVNRAYHRSRKGANSPRLASPAVKNVNRPNASREDSLRSAGGRKPAGLGQPNSYRSFTKKAVKPDP